MKTKMGITITTMIVLVRIPANKQSIS
jgi:hypothetical protein